MDKGMKRHPLRHFRYTRIIILGVVCALLSGILIHRLYDLQIINGESYRTNFSIKTTKTRTLKSTRGNIYDRNGKVLAYNKLSYSLTLEDSGSYDTYRQRDLSLNGEAYRIAKILSEHGDSLDNDFHVVLDKNGQYTYDVDGRTLQRFKADVYGCAKISDMTEEQAQSTADQMIQTLSGKERFGLVRSDKPYTAEELKKAGLPETLSPEDTLNIIYVRYQLFTTQYRKYMPVTIARRLSDQSVAALNEEKDSLEGIEIVEDTTRVYSNAVPFASLIGYIGKVSSEDLAELQSSDSSYTSESIVGKSGIEKVCESTLQGSDGQETVYVDRFGKVLEQDESKTIQPTAGGNVYLTIDSDLQNAIYKILEQRIAGILETVIIDADTFDTSGVTDTANIRVPVTDVYDAIIENGVLDLSQLSAPNATSSESQIYSIFTQKQSEVFSSLSDQLTGSAPTPYNQLSDEMKEYESYIVNDLLTAKTGILDSSKIDKTDATYLAWTRDETISLKDYLTYAASRNWINISAINSDETYMDSEETYQKLSEYIRTYLATDTAFSKILYKYLIDSKTLSGALVLEALYDQGILSNSDGTLDELQADASSAYSVVLKKIDDLELTPAMLALDPCSGSAVVTDPNTGEILACVSYPGYDNNRLANTMDVSYYNKLAADKSGPFYNKATQQETAPGSTFKLITTTAGLEEKVITKDTIFNCTGTFDLTETPLKCWLTTGHGPLNIIGGIQNSCNVFFCNVAYQLGLNEEGNWSDSLSLSKLQQYAKLYNMDKPSGIEVPENDPQVSDQYAIQSSIGQGTHAYTTTQLARYVTTLANSGTSYNLSMIDKTTDAEGNVIKDYSPSVESQLSISSSTWDIIHEGMRAVIESKPDYTNLGVEVAGKTGTAQESKSRPSHALFICYAPYDKPQIAMAIRIGNGYSSTNCLLTARDILQYYFKLADTSEIITGKAKNDSLSSANVD